MGLALVIILLVVVAVGVVDNTTIYDIQSLSF